MDFIPPLAEEDIQTLFRIIYKILTTAPGLHILCDSKVRDDISRTARGIIFLSGVNYNSCHAWSSSGLFQIDKMLATKKFKDFQPCFYN